MFGRSLRRHVAAGVLMMVLTLPVAAGAVPAAGLAPAPDLWTRAWEWVASWWEGLAEGASSRPAGEKEGGLWTSDGPPLTPNGTTSTTLPGPTGPGEVGAGTDPNG